MARHTRTFTLVRVGAASAAILLLALASTVAQNRSAEAIEIGPRNVDLLPRGKEADGIVGDFVLQNDRIRALVSGNQPDRRANMATEYAFPTPGCLYDLDLRGAENDQLTVLRPGDQAGPLSYVRVARDGRDGVAAVEAVRTAAAGGGLYTRHEYRVEPGWQCVLVTSTYRNESSEPKQIQPAPVWKEFSRRWTVGQIQIGDSVDPFDKRAYAWTPAPRQGVSTLEEKVTLAPGQEKIYAVAVAVGDSPLQAYGVAAALGSRTGEVKGRAAQADGTGAAHAAIWVGAGGQDLPAYPDAQGIFSFRLPAGDYTARFADLGRDQQTQDFRASEGGTSTLRYSLGPASAVSFDVRDGQGQPVACKVQFLGRSATPAPDLGTEVRAHGANHQYFSHNGQFVQQVPPGDYTVRISHGPEFDLVEREITVPRSETVTVSTALRRTVDTRGWISTDYHSHSTQSGDNYTGTADRIINLAVEHIEFAPTTEHNRIYNWADLIDSLKLSRSLRTVIGIELTGSGQHFNSFPLVRTPYAQDGGAPKWNHDPRVTAILLREAFDGGPDRWVQANHPIVGEVFNDRNRDGIEDGGYTGFERLIDAAEVWSDEILNLQPYVQSRKGERMENRAFGWLQMLNKGRHVWCVAVSDAHRIVNGGVGGWRTYVASSKDDPAELSPEEIIRNSKAGRMMITNGPFLEVSANDGQSIGSTLISPGGVKLHVRVQTPNWLDVDRVQVLVNGRQPGEYNFTRARNPQMFYRGVVKFDNDITVKLQRDAHLIVVATGEKSDLSEGWGKSYESSMHPMAYTNPIYVDVDGGGFQPNGDTLGHPTLVVSPKN